MSKENTVSEIEEIIESVLKDEKIDIQLPFEKSFFSDVPIPLTSKQECFCREYIRTRSFKEAHKIAYPNNMSDKTRTEAASRLKKDSKIIARLQQLDRKIEDKLIMSAREALWINSKLARDEGNSASDRTAATKVVLQYRGAIAGDGAMTTQNFNVAPGGAVTIEFVNARANIKTKSIKEDADASTSASSSNK